jgi:hypothetical protein
MVYRLPVYASESSVWVVGDVPAAREGLFVNTPYLAAGTHSSLWIHPLNTGDNSATILIV